MTEVLSLSTIVKRDTINIDSKRWPNGKTYELANAADFGPYEYALLHDRQQEVAPLLTRKRLTKKQEQRVNDILDEIVRKIVIGLEPAVLRELTSEQKQMLLLTWTAAISQGAAEGNARRATRSTGSK